VTTGVQLCEGIPHAPARALDETVSLRPLDSILKGRSSLVGVPRATAPA